MFTIFRGPPGKAPGQFFLQFLTYSPVGGPDERNPGQTLLRAALAHVCEDVILGAQHFHRRVGFRDIFTAYQCTEVKHFA